MLEMLVKDDIARLVHEPVMVNEAVELLNVRPGGRYVDCTAGAGGHSAAILDAAPDTTVVALDADAAALEVAGRTLARYGDRVRLRNANFRDVGAVCRLEGFAQVEGMLFDLGISSMQLEGAGRGFSFQEPDAPLDMRLSAGQRRTAADIVNKAAEDDLAAMLWTFGEERRSKRIAAQIVAARPIHTVGQLTRVIEQVAGRARSSIHPATKTFQALRIAVNEELDALAEALRQVPDLLVSGGRLVVISFHSLEDRIVKQFIQAESRGCICPPRTPVCICGHVARLRPVTKGALTPSEREVRTNRRARSAKLRAAERIAA